MSTFLQEHDFPPGPLPPLPQLPVLRENYCTQEVADKALQYLWDNAPDLVREQAKREHLNFDQEYSMQLGHIVDFFQKEASKEIEIPTSRLGMLDLLFEMSRRLRKARGLPEWKLLGRPLAENPHASMPELPVLPVRRQPEHSTYYITQEMADRLISGAYKERPDLFYEWAESMRRGGLYGYGAVNELRNLFFLFTSPTDNLTLTKASSVGGEANRRLRTCCGIDIPGENSGAPP